MKNGFSGNIAKCFHQSKLTILLMIAFLLIGGYSTLLIPREEEPQIEVPMADIFIGFPGADQKKWKQNWQHRWKKLFPMLKVWSMCILLL